MAPRGAVRQVRLHSCCSAATDHVLPTVMSGGVNRGQEGSGGVNRGQDGSTGVNRGQEGTGGVNRGQEGTGGVNMGQQGSGGVNRASSCLPVAPLVACWGAWPLDVKRLLSCCVSTGSVQHVTHTRGAGDGEPRSAAEARVLGPCWAPPRRSLHTLRGLAARGGGPSKEIHVHGTGPHRRLRVNHAAPLAL
ncbi:hypothetical protein EYF80_054447 [Liparis tanakae]|uniref:Uncharacterized protein n=1 Tax=Liparis tanakae TaxID=230148 RepID=A0A4Z2F3Q0_9TELE|nr:hypothetical protein EYF80_054447 [Liparis tanakae]